MPWPRQFLPWGLFAYFLVLGFIVAARVHDIHRSLKIHSANLETAGNRLREHAENLEDKVRVRTAELQNTLDQVRALKAQQDGDYYLTSLLMQPLRGTALHMEKIRIDMLVSQKKKFNSRIAKRKSAAIYACLEACYRELHKTFLPFNGNMLVSVALGLLRSSTGELFYVNAEHPQPVLIHSGRAGFPEVRSGMRKLGAGDTSTKFVCNRLTLKPGDVFVVGSDGHDDLITGLSESGRNVYNDDERKFLSVIGEGGDSLQAVEQRLRENGEITDDLSLMRIQYGE